MGISILFLKNCLRPEAKKRIEAEIVKVDYDINFVAQQVDASEIPDFYGDFLLKK